MGWGLRPGGSLQQSYELHSRPSPCGRIGWLRQGNAWSLIWLSQDRHPLLRTLLRRFAETGLRRRWLEYDAARDWLPAHDQAELQRLEHLTAQRRA